MAFYNNESLTPLPPVYEKEILQGIYPQSINIKTPKAKEEAQVHRLSFTIQQSKINNMQHNISNRVSVYETLDYKKFITITGNRAINQKKVKRIIKEIDGGNDMLQYYPIQVQENGELLNILDGQHRFTITKILKRPVYYILVKEAKTMPEIAKINTNVEKWKPADYINCYIKSGNDHYTQLHNFMQQYKFSVGICLHLLNCGNPGRSNGEVKSITHDFQQGDFTVKFYDTAVFYATLVEQFSFFTNWRSRDFLLAIYKIHTAAKIPFGDIEEAIKNNSNMITQQGNNKEYIYKIEQIVNIGKKNRIVII
jgi:hypothetical protein